MIDGMGGGASATNLLDNVKRNYENAVLNHGAKELDFSDSKTLPKVIDYFKINKHLNPPDMSDLKTQAYYMMGIGGLVFFCSGGMVTLL